MQRFTELAVWKRSHELALAVYRASEPFPGSETFGISSQLRRAAVSVPANIAEGSKRMSRKEYCHLLNVAEGSLAEVEYLLMLARELGYLQQATATALLAEAEEVASMLAGLRRAVDGRQRRREAGARSELSTLNSQPIERRERGGHQ